MALSSCAGKVAAITGAGSGIGRALVLALAARGDVGVESTTYSLDDAVTAYHDLHEGRITGRAVIVP